MVFATTQLGHLRVRDLRRRDVQDFIDHLRTCSLAASTVHNKLDEAVEAQRIATAEQALADGPKACGDQLQGARRRADALAAKRLDALRQAETERGQVRPPRRLWRPGGRHRALRLAQDGQAGGRPHRCGRHPQRRRAAAVSEVIDALERYLAASTQQAEDQQAAGRIAQAEQDERDREEIAEYRRQFPGVAVPGS